MTRKERFSKILAWFRENRPVAVSELNYDSPFHLLLAVMLSAQCTDKRVNQVTPALFKRFPRPEDLAASSFEELFPLIRSVSYPNSKARHILQTAELLVSRHSSEVPSDIDQLMKLPGVGRKTANVIASIIYDKPVIAVDTHVFRVSHRLGLSSGKTPDAVEKDLEKHIPVEERAKSHHWLILHGRYICTARNPECGDCGLKEFCKYYSNSCGNVLQHESDASLK